MRKLFSASVALSLMLVGCSDSEQTGSKGKEKEDVEETEETPVAVDSVVKLTPEQKEEQQLQEEIELNFEADMKIIIDQIDNLLQTYYDFAKGYQNGQIEANTSTLSPSMKELDTLITYLESMSDYSESDRYGEMYSELKKGLMILTQAKLAFNSFVVFDNEDFVIDGHDKLSQCIVMLTETALSYTKSHAEKNKN